MAGQFVNEFMVNRAIDEAWPIICDLERIAPCLPGAQLDEVEGDIHRGTVKVRLGAVSTQFKGQAELVERDDTARIARLTATGRDTGGRGTAQALVAAHAEALSPTSTRVTVTTEMQISGRIAQFAVGVLETISKKLMEQFATNLNVMLDEPAAAAPVARASTPEAVEPQATSTVRIITGPAAEPIDVAGLAGPPIFKLLAPAIAAVGLLLLILNRRK